LNFNKKVAMSDNLILPTKFYSGPNRLSWRGRKDGPQPTRFHEVIQCFQADAEFHKKEGVTSFGFIGFAVDTGIERNQGRIGAAHGPISARESLANIPLANHETMELFDFGNVICENGNLEVAQELLGQIVARVMNKGIIPIVIGGGHETTWGSFQGILKRNSPKVCGIINFDSHFDLRPLLPGNLGSSGTPFLQIADALSKIKRPFHYTVLGIQQFGNTSALIEQAKKLNVHWVTAEEIHLGNTDSAIKAIDQAVLRNDELYISVDLDCFAAAYAPGVSATQPLGFTPWQVIPLIRHLVRSGKVIAFDVAELSPEYDTDGVTAQLAAAIIATFVWTAVQTADEIRRGL